jgi:hypothetical protein
MNEAVKEALTVRLYRRNLRPPTRGAKTMPALDREIQTYKNKLPELTASEGKFVLICGDGVMGVFDSYQDALTAGYERCGIKPFLVKQISSVEVLASFTRDLNLCRT